MNETLLQYWERVRQFWNKFSKSQRLIFLATVVLLVLALVLVSVKMSKTEYEVAFTDLQPTDAKAIKDYLDTAKIPYQISADGKTIGVAKNQVTNVRLDVISQGLDKTGSVGYGSFSSNSAFGMTDNEFKIKQLSAVQGEIQQVINSFVSVASSKVMINLPDDSVFLPKDPKDNQASASVVVQLKQGYTLDQQKIDTMYELVSKSVKNLPVDNITISDQYGDLLPYSKSAAGQSSYGDIASQLAIKKAFEQDIYSKVMSILGGVLGPGKVVPMVVATLDFTKKTSKENLVQPVVDQQGLEISVQKIQKTYNSDGGGATGGIAGTGSTDVPNYPGTTGTGKSSSEEISNTINYEVNRIQNDIQSSPYAVTDLSISVGVEPPDKNNPNSLTQDTMDAIQKLLVNVVSTSLANSGKTYTDADLAKKVTVFQHTLAINNAPATTNNAKWWTYGGIGLAAMLLAGFGGFAIARRRRRAAEAAMEELQVAPAADIPSIDLDTVSNENQMRKQLESLAKKKPEEFVNLLRTWLADE